MTVEWCVTHAKVRITLCHWLKDPVFRFKPRGCRDWHLHLILTTLTARATHSRLDHVFECIGLRIDAVCSHRQDTVLKGSLWSHVEMLETATAHKWMEGKECRCATNILTNTPGRFMEGQRIRVCANNDKVSNTTVKTAIIPSSPYSLSSSAP